VAASGGGSRQTRWKGLAHSAEAQTSMPSPAAPHTLHRSRVHSSRLAAGGAAGLGGFEIEAEVEIVAEVEAEVDVVVAAAVAALVASLGVALGAGLGAVVSWVASVSIRSSSPNSPRHTAHLQSPSGTASSTGTEQCRCHARGQSSQRSSSPAPPHTAHASASQSGQSQPSMPASGGGSRHSRWKRLPQAAPPEHSRSAASPTAA